MNAHRCAPFLTALFLVSSGAFGAPVRVKDSGISFVAKANVGLVIEGTTSALLVSEDAKNVTLVVELGGLTTGVDLRDKHMRERYLEVPKFPTASLVIEKACLALPEAGDKSGECAGAFTLHGETKGVVVKFKATVTGSGATTSVDASFSANFMDHGVEEPKYLGIKLKPTVEVRAKFTASR